jgi:hypothetical protein
MNRIGAALAILLGKTLSSRKYRTKETHAKITPGLKSICRSQSQVFDQPLWRSNTAQQLQDPQAM